jgi:Protein kinase domain
MVLPDADIIFGKIVLGRDYLSRSEAGDIAEELEAAARRGRSESFPSAALRLGFLGRDRVDEVNTLLTHGELVCRGQCGARRPLARVKADETAACQSCGGPLYLARLDLAAVEEKGSTTFIDMSTPQVDPQPPDPVSSASAQADPEPAQAEQGAEDESGELTFMELEFTGVPEPSREAASPAFDPAAPTVMPDPESGVVAPLFDLDLQVLTPSGPPEPAFSEESTMEFDAPPVGETWRSEDEPPQAGFEPFKIAPNLSIEAPIGRGGMGVVYRGRLDDFVVAVKVLAAQAHPSVLARFDREVRLASALNHPNIVTVLDTGTVPSGEHEGQPYLVMDYIRGRDLAAWVLECPRSPAACSEITAMVCRAMAHAHSKGILHRDIKPANILVKSEGDVPMLCDFGLARYRAETNSLTRTGDILGTPAYMSPEQAVGKKHEIGPATDIYALGAVLFHLLTGRPPFVAPTIFSTIDRVVREPAAAPSSINRAVPPALDAVVLKALEKSPLDRYHTAEQLAQAMLAAAPA